MKMDELSQSAMDAVTDGRVKMVPERYTKGYLDWLGEKRDWPIGRQLWWGHQIAVWHLRIFAERYQGTCPIDAAYQRAHDEFTAVFADFAAACGIECDVWIVRDEISDSDYYICGRNDHAIEELREFQIRNFRARFVPLGQPDLPGGIPLPPDDKRFATESELRPHIRIMDEQEPDVLNTWFSSALWPQSTLGWPDETPELKRFYPTTTLITSRDIITLWVARMVIAGLYNVGNVPFHEVFITPKILDGYGETMSKSKGNGVDPLDIIDKFGADALRFGIAHLTTETQDVRMPVEFECPHCHAVFPQTKKNRQLPRIECEKCGKPFSTQWAEKPEDKALPRGAYRKRAVRARTQFC